MASRTHLLLAALPFLVTPGCCSIASLFCGPDRSPWVPIAFETPKATLRTFLEAIRRSNADVIYLCMAEEWKQELGVSGMELNLVWERIQEENPYIHYAGTAKVPEEPTSRGVGGASYRLEVSGYRFQVDLVQRPYFEVKAENERGDVLDDGDFVVALHDLVHLTPTPDEIGTQVEIRVIAATQAIDRPESLIRVGVGHEWKVRGVNLLEE